MKGRDVACEEFLYGFKRRLRAARKRAVLAAEYRALGSPASPSSPQYGPAVPSTRLLSHGMVRSRRVGGVVSYKGVFAMLMGQVGRVRAHGTNRARTL
jgi:hypothetical protein